VGCAGEGTPDISSWTAIDDGPSSYPTCEGSPGSPRVEFIEDDERHEPVTDDAVYEIARRLQGEVTIIAPVWFGGLDGGDLVDDFGMTFTDLDGERLGERFNGTLRLPCEEDGSVAGHWFEVFFGDPLVPVEAWDAVSGRLAVSFMTSSGLLVEDAVSARLTVAP